jgi:hypothetical protein
MMAPNPAPEVAAFVSGQPVELLFSASICQAEVLSGIAIMPERRRRLDLEAAARAMFLEDFVRRVLPFDMEAAIAYADVFAARRAARAAGGDCRSHDRRCRLSPECKRRHPQHRRFRGVRRRHRQSVEWAAMSIMTAADRRAGLVAAFRLRRSAAVPMKNYANRLFLISSCGLDAYWPVTSNRRRARRSGSYWSRQACQTERRQR